MTTVGLQMVPRGLEPGGVVVVDLPPPTTRLRNLYNAVIPQALTGETALVRAWCARGGMDDRDLEPMDRHGIVTTSQAHVVDGAHHRHCHAATSPMAACTLGPTVVGLPTRHALREWGMGVGLTRQDAGATVLEHQRTPGLVAGESIAQEGHAMGSHVLGRWAYPARARRPFAVLCGMPVVRHDVLGGQGHALGLSGAHDPWGDGGMGREVWASGAWTGETVVAMPGGGRQGVGAIHGHQPLVAKDPHMRHHAVPLV